MSTLTYKFNVLQADGVTVMSPLPTFTVHAVGLDGASTLTTGGKARGFPTVTFNADGTLPTYTITAPVPGTDPTAPPYTYIIKQGAVVLREGTFTPIETSAGIVNLNILLTSNFAKAVTPQMYSDVATLIANGTAAVSTLTGDGNAALASLDAATARANAAADLIGATGLLYGGTNPDDSINLIVPSGIAVSSVPYTLPSGTIIQAYQFDISPLNTDPGVY